MLVERILDSPYKIFIKTTGGMLNYIRILTKTSLKCVNCDILVKDENITLEHFVSVREMIKQGIYDRKAHILESNLFVCCENCNKLVIGETESFNKPYADKVNRINTYNESTSDQIKKFVKLCLINLPAKLESIKKHSSKSETNKEMLSIYKEILYWENYFNRDGKKEMLKEKRKMLVEALEKIDAEIESIN